MKWWKKYLSETDQDTHAVDAVSAAQERLIETEEKLDAIDEIATRVDAVTSNIRQELVDNHLVLRIREAYGQQYGA